MNVEIGQLSMNIKKIQIKEIYFHYGSIFPGDKEFYRSLTNLLPHNVCQHCGGKKKKQSYYQAY